MADYTEEDKQKVLEQLGKKAWKYSELAKILKMDKKTVVKIVQDLINEGKAAYWSSGSTTYVTSKEHLEEMEKKRSEG
jgi:predicted transcriptional regulator